MVGRRASRCCFFVSWYREKGAGENILVQVGYEEELLVHRTVEVGLSDRTADADRQSQIRLS